MKTCGRKRRLRKPAKKHASPPAFPERTLRIEVWKFDPEIRIGYFTFTYRQAALTVGDLAFGVAEKLFTLLKSKIPADHFSKSSLESYLSDPGTWREDAKIPF